ncbi:flippase-like domain-containing protein [bacterium]|nr:flippase-like domain-containing protein [bacterium]
MNKSRWKKWVGIVISAVALGYLIRSLVISYEEGEVNLEQVDFKYLVLGVLIVIIAYFVLGLLWREVYRGLYSRDVKYYVALAMMFLPNIMRYIPGKIWFVFGIAYWADRWDLKVTDAIVSSLVMMAISLSAAVAVGLATIGFSGAINIPPWVLVGWIFFTVIFFTTPVFSFTVKIAARFFKKNYLSEIEKIPFALFLKGFVIGVLYWIMMGLSVYVMGFAVRELPFSSCFKIVGAFSMSYFAGYVTLISPAGLGIREGAFAALLPKSIPYGERVMISLLSRVTTTLAEVLLLFIAILTIKLKEGYIFTKKVSQ